MPARELGSSFGPPNGTHAIGTTLLKRHKILPHPREDPAPVHYPSPPPVKPRDLTIDTSVPSKPSSDASSPHILKHTSKRIGGLPPTPPTHSRQSSGSHPVVPSAPRFDVKPLRSPADIPVTPRTPPNQRSPPTPDVTPPRGMPLAFRTPFRPALSDRYPSSRTDSFRTAPENPYSSGDDDEDVSTVRPVLPSARASELTIIPQLPERSVRRKEIGLGLGLESEGTATPRPRGKSPQEAFVVFDGEWGSQVEEASEVEREWDDNLMRNVTVRKRPGRNIHMFTDGATDEVVEDNIVSPNIATRVARSLPLQERIARHRLQRDTADRSSTEKFAQTISWPGEVPDPESPVSADARRVSTMSAKSGYSTVIVDAMVVDAPAQRRKTLRHTKKHLGLRDFSSEHSPASSAPTSVVSSEPPHRLVHKSAGIPKRRHQSLNSSTTVSTTSSSGKSRREVINNGGIPVVVIPDRRSSSKSSKTPSLRSTSSHKTKRSNSLNSAPISHSAKFNEPGYFDVPRHKRTMSESASSAVSERTMDFPPNIPARRSSLSAPTSRNTSRAGSLTTESLKAHNILQARKQDIKSVEVPKTQSQSSPESHRGRYKSSVDHNGDPFFGNRLSAQATPFSQTSYETTGTTAEVSEAMMVNIFPHQNKSVLVVQHENSPIDASSKDLPMANELEKVESVQPPKQPTMAINDEPTTGPVTPPQPIHPMDAVDSPLRNPRAPPAPPAIKFIPPTPAGLTPGHEEERQLGYDPNEVRPNTSDEKPKRGLSIVRRALSKRRNSESAVSTGSLLRETFFLPQKKKESTDESTQTSKGEANPSSLYPTVADRPPDGSKLHPFWRPTHFWDDLEDRDEEDYADDELGYYPMIDNRPGPPKRSLSSTLKRTFAILPIQDENRYESDRYPTERRTMRRSASGNMKVVKQRSQSSLRRGSSSPPTTRYRGAVLKEGDFGYGFKDGNGGKREGGYLIPGLGVRVEYVGWGGMKRKIRDKRRAQRSDKLRGTISSPRGVRSGMDDVLRRRSQI